MKICKLSEISINISSGMTPLRSNSEFWDNGIIPWLKTEQLGEKYIFDTNEYISEKALKETNAKIFPENTLSIAMYGEGKTRGNVSILKRSMATNQACCNVELDTKKANPEYVYYFLKTQYNNLRLLSSGIRKNLNSNDIKNFYIKLPNLTTQKSIAHILSTLDQKIAINNQINAQLEQMAKTLYDYWFVQFDFPDENGKLYKSSGGEMVYNETLKREIPKGWEVKSLGEVVDLKNGINYSASDYGDTQAKIVNVRDVSNCSIFIKSNELDILSLDNKKLLPYQINEKNILVVRSGKPGATRLLGNVKYLTIYCGFIIAIVPKKEIMRNLIFWFLKNQELKIESQSAGTVLKNVSQDTLKGSLFLIPNSENLILKFNTLIDDIFKKICCFDEQNQQLTQLRDFLLPMLMNGQVGVGDD
jgi:type I restriction-modification system specificity subunit